MLWERFNKWVYKGASNLLLNQYVNLNNLENNIILKVEFGILREFGGIVRKMLENVSPNKEKTFMS